MPLTEVTPGDSVFYIKVLGGWPIYIRVAGKMDRSDFSRTIRAEAVDDTKDKSDGLIREFGYGDDYEQWLQREAFFSRSDETGKP